LRCEQSRHKNCCNKTSFQYETFERLVLDLSTVGMQEMLSNLLPRPEADPRHRRLAELEAMIVSREEQVEAAWSRWLNPEAKVSESMRQRAEQQLERMDREVAAYRDEVTSLRQELRLLAVHEDDKFHERVRVAKGQLATTTGEELKSIRMRLAQEMRRRIERITFRENGSAILRIREWQGLAKVDVWLTAAAGLRCIDVLAFDGSVLTRFDGAGLALLEPIASAEAA
jgi:hypothetical protein